MKSKIDYWIYIFIFGHTKYFDYIIIYLNFVLEVLFSPVNIFTWLLVGLVDLLNWDLKHQIWAIKTYWKLETTTFDIVGLCVWLFLTRYFHPLTLTPLNSLDNKMKNS